MADDSDDYIIPVCKTEHGVGVIRHRPNSDKIELGLIKPLENGKTIQGELVTISPAGEGVFKIQKFAGEGPAQVATEKYRDGWDKIFGKPNKNSELN